MTFRLTDLPVSIVEFHICPFLEEENRELAKIFWDPDLGYINNYYKYRNIAEISEAKKIRCLENFTGTGIDIKEFSNLENLEYCVNFSVDKKISSLKLTEFPKLQILRFYIHEPIIDLCNFKNLKTLYLTNKLNQPIKVLNLEKLVNLEILSIKCGFSDNMDTKIDFELPDNITYLIYEPSYINFDFKKLAKLEILNFENSSFDDPVFEGEDSVLKYLPNLNSLSLPSLYNKPVDGLRYFTKLKYLKFHSNKPITDLKYLTNLEILICEDYDHVLSGIWYLKNLKNLTFRSHREGYIEYKDNNIQLEKLENVFFHTSNTKPADFLKYAKNLKVLDIGNSSIPFNYIKNLQDLYLTHYFCRPLFTDDDPGIKYLSNLKKLDFFYDFSYEYKMPKLNYFSKLEFLRLSNNFNKTISELKYMVNLKVLIFGTDFNQSISELKYLINLKRLEFGRAFNQPVPELQYLAKLEELKFGVAFNQPVPELRYLTKLKILKFGICFNQPVPELRYLTKLEILKFGGAFNQPVPGLRYLTKLKNLEFEKCFNQPIPELQFLVNLEYLSFGVNFNQHISDAKYLTKLERLFLGDYFNQPIPIIKYLTNLSVLFVGSKFNQPIPELAKLKNLTVLHFSISNRLYRHLNF